MMWQRQMTWKKFFAVEERETYATNVWAHKLQMLFIFVLLAFAGISMNIHDIHMSVGLDCVWIQARLSNK